MLKQKILNGEKTIAMLHHLTDISVAKIIGLAGYDYIWIDMEHTYFSHETLLEHIIAIKATGTPVVVRVPQDELTVTKKVLEMGVDGIIFPMVKSAEEIDRLIASTLYPPYGDRGFGPMNAIDYGYNDAKEYVEHNHERMCRFIQIEHKQVVEELDEIIKNPYIDGYILGPNDLSGSYGMMLDVFSEKITEVIRGVVDKLHKAGKYVGLATGDTREEVLQHWKNLDIDMIVAGADYDYIRIMANENRKNLERIYKKFKE